MSTLDEAAAALAEVEGQVAAARSQLAAAIEEQPDLERRLADAQSAARGLQAQLDRQTAARGAAEAELGAERQRRAGEVETIRADTRERLALAADRAHAAEAAQRQAATQLAAAVEAAQQQQTRHEAELTQLQQRRARAVADLQQRHDRQTEQLRAHHRRELDEAAGSEAAKARQDAEAAANRVEVDLQQERRQHATTKASATRLAGELDHAKAARSELGSALEATKGEHARTQAELDQAQAALQETRAHVQQLQEQLKPRTPELEVLVRFVRDTAASIGDVRVAGRGPRYARHDLAPGVPHSVLVRPGELARVPLPAAKELERSGHVELVGPARWSAALDYLRAVVPGRSLSTAVELAAAAAQCRGWATELERHGARWLAEEQHAQAELAQQQTEPAPA
jgi:hypothetical protein